MLLAMGCYTNVLVKAGFESLADTLQEFRPFDFQKAASGLFMTITIILWQFSLCAMPIPGEDLFYSFGPTSIL